MEQKDIKNFEMVVGLEVHIQLNTRSKAFNRDLNEFGHSPNSNVSAITLAHPGTLPKANTAHLAKAIRLAVATNSTINRQNQFDRKNYFYPDLPKGYQITQDRLPFCEGGAIEFESGGKKRKVRLHHIHMEEDAGKSSHELSPSYSMLDYNRAGTPLVEMVTEPDLRSAEEVHDFMAYVQKMVKFIGISDGNMEEGSMRCDCNVSIRPKGSTKFGERCEIKNVNSKKFAKQAVEYEFRRQFKMVQNGIEITKQTLNFNPETGITTTIRSKEDAHDYRYFPDPDLPPIVISEKYIEKIQSDMPMLPEAYLSLLQNKYSLSNYDASVLTQEKEDVDYYLHLSSKIKHHKELANLLINKIIPSANEQNMKPHSYVHEEKIAEFIAFVTSDKVSKSSAYQLLFPEMVKSPEEPLSQIAARLKILKSEDQSFVTDLIDKLITDHPAEVEKYRNGNKGLVGFFMGQAMRASSGKADPKVLKKYLLEKLSEE